MCKIILKYKNPLSWEEVTEHRETNEDGAGFTTMKGGKFETFRDFKHLKAFEAYKKSPDSPFVLFHSRMPSAGLVNRDNIQPFDSESLAFCHNGTEGHRELALLCLSAKVKFKYSDSDSSLLFKLLIQAHLQSSIAMLVKLGGNFILVSAEEKKVYGIGRFKHDTVKGSMLKAWNAFNTDKIYFETSLDGKIEEFIILESNSTTHWEKQKQEALNKFLDGATFEECHYKEGEIVGYTDKKTGKYHEYKEKKEEKIKPITYPRNYSGHIEDDSYPDAPAFEVEY